MGRLALQGGAQCLSGTRSLLGEHHESTVATHVKGLGSGLAACLLPFLEDQDQVPARERNPLVQQLDTLVETIGCIPVLRGPRLHAL